MNIRRGDTSKLVVTGRQVAGETHYLCVFQRLDAPSFYQYCIAENIGSTSGPLLLEVIETDSATATDGEVTLGVGDWSLTVYGQDNGTNLDAANSDRTVWNELLTVDGDTTETPSYPPEGGGTGSAPDADRCRYIRVCGDPTDGQVVAYDATARRWTVADPESGGVTDHGALSGLDDDDHTQYLNNARGDARYDALGAAAAAKSDAISAAASDATTKASAAQAASAPAVHTHAISDVTGLQAALDGKQAAGSYAASSHTHAISEVTGLQTALDGKQAAGSYADASHSHAISDVTGLQTALDGKAASSHSHAISDVTGLQTALDGKQAAGTYATGTGSADGTNTGDQDLSGLVVKSLAQAPTPTTGQTQTFNTLSKNETIACLHSGTIAAQTFVLPSDANSAIGQELVIFSRAAITAVTLTANGNTIYGASFTSIAASGIYRIRKVASSIWVRV